MFIFIADCAVVVCAVLFLIMALAPLAGDVTTRFKD